MLRKLDESTSDALGYEVREKLTGGEFDSFAQEFEAAISRHGKVRLLLYMPEIPGVDPAALWGDLKLMRYRNAIARYAVVSDSALAEWASRLEELFIGGELKQFDVSQYEEAWRWVRRREAEG